MAAVTIISQRFDVFGNRRVQSYRITGGNGDTLTTGLNSIIEVDNENIATNPATVSISGGVVTFASSGTYTNMGVQITGN